ncbi:hypothetical protein Tco_0857590 [Tanacetum coccineum]|uniref:Uncharacterized protein n=1 Tax=Tanacetum coccineum TaxID=301880 RepID=A0ABQ5BAM7_9ASTR
MSERLMALDEYLDEPLESDHAHLLLGSKVSLEWWPRDAMVTNKKARMRWKVVVMVWLSKRVTRCFLGVQGCKEKMEVLVRCWSDGDVPTSVPCTLPTQGMGSIISMVSISPEGFLPSILMLVVIIVTVVIVTVILVVVVVDDVSPILKLSFVIIGFLYRIVL